jgi:hypothetical protein
MPFAESAGNVGLAPAAGLVKAFGVGGSSSEEPFFFRHIDADFLFSVEHRLNDTDDGCFDIVLLTVSCILPPFPVGDLVEARPSYEWSLCRLCARLLFARPDLPQESTLSTNLTEGKAPNFLSMFVLSVRSVAKESVPSLDVGTRPAVRKQLTGTDMVPVSDSLLLLFFWKLNRPDSLLLREDRAEAVGAITRMSGVFSGSDSLDLKQPICKRLNRSRLNPQHINR